MFGFITHMKTFISKPLTKDTLNTRGAGQEQGRANHHTLGPYSVPYTLLFHILYLI